MNRQRTGIFVWSQVELRIWGHFSQGGYGDRRVLVLGYRILAHGGIEFSQHTSSAIGIRFVGSDSFQSPVPGNWLVGLSLSYQTHCVTFPEPSSQSL